MPSHWGHKRLNIVSQSSPTGTQCLHAIGTAEAGRLLRDGHRDRGTRDALPGRRSHLRLDRRRHDERRRVLGVAELRLHAQAAGRLSWSRTTATRSRCRSKCRRPAATSRSSSPSFPGLFVQSIDGTDFLASYSAMSAAVDYARARKGPALVHAKVIRPYSHSLSDDEKLYKTADERAAEATRDPITRLATLLDAGGHRDRGRARSRSSARSKRRSTPRPTRRSQSEKPVARHRAALRLLARRRSRVARVQHRRRRPKASPTRWSRPSTAR